MEIKRTAVSVRTVWVGTGVLLAAAIAIIPHMDNWSFWYDELWAIMHSMGSVHQIATDPDLLWPPGYYFVLHGWIGLISFHDFVVRALSVYLGLLSVALMVRAGRALHSERAGWLAGLLYATNVFAAYYRLEARGYSLMLLGLPLVLWTYARWWKKPTWRRAIPYGLAHTFLFYAQVTSALSAPLFLGTHLFLTAPRRLWRWALIMGGVVVLAAPILPQYYDIYMITSEARRHIERMVVVDTPLNFYQAYSARQNIVWAAILGLAVFGLVRGSRHNRRFAATASVLTLWGVGVPVYAYVTRYSSGLFGPRYLLFTVPAMLMVLGLGLAQLPRRALWVGTALLVYMALAPWHPFDYRPLYRNGDYPVRDLIRYFDTHFQAGDTLVIDPSLDDPTNLSWWYYEQVYFPLGKIPRAKDGYQAGPRVWHLVRQGEIDQDVLHSVEEERLQTGEFWGPWYFIATLYEGPPLTPGFRFGESIHFRGGDISTGRVYRPGDVLTVRTWWSVDAPPEADYSISVYIVSPTGELVAQHDSGPLGHWSGERTSTWQPGEIYLDERSITIPKGWGINIYDVRVTVYQWQDGKRLPVHEGDSRDYRDPQAVSIGTIRISTYNDTRRHRHTP